MKERLRQGGSVDKKDAIGRSLADGVSGDPYFGAVSGAAGADASGVAAVSDEAAAFLL